MTVILIFGNRPTSDNVEQCRAMPNNVGQCQQYHVQFWHGRQYGGRIWNLGALSRRLQVISTSGLMAAIFYFGSLSFIAD